MLGRHAEYAKALPGLSAYQVGLARDGLYAVGEALLDCVEQFSFRDVASVEAAKASLAWAMLVADWGLCTEERWRHEMLIAEHWIIGPDPRPHVAR
ncbi:hypothetical protein A33M_2522 [Rhodovulum sp. PH10]|uniref:hypothetical protein n=1 Tax=Rhodovulum sp. PH10 TaxID=1187851 RepID=UPI00027C2CD1|nr:hypothetical protein [Rhodovulum sp. PH10]EJW12045.1 hypothetical protein A33M_2522 [Rhodovulum sp. PH10]